MRLKHIFMIIVILLLISLGIFVMWDDDNNDIVKDIDDVVHVEEKEDNNNNVVFVIVVPEYNITLAEDNGRITIIKGEYAPSFEKIRLDLTCKHEDTNYLRRLLTTEKGHYLTIMNNSLCGAGDVIQICTEDNKCSDKIVVNGSQEKEVVLRYTTGSNHKQISVPTIAVPEYSTLSALMLIFAMSCLMIFRLRV